LAARYDFKEISELLIDEGADLNAKDKTGHTPLNWAKRHPEASDLLRKNTAARRVKN
jgi:ankyrin repeat protein